MAGRSTTRKVLIIAYLFPPVGGIGAAGSQRALKFAKYLPQYRWEPIILTVRESCYESYLKLDRTLSDRLPSGIEIIRTPVIRWLAKLLAWKNKRRNSRDGGLEIKDNETQQKVATRGWYQVLKDSLTECFEIPDEEIGWLIPGVLAGVRAIRKEGIDVIYSTGKPWTAHLIGLLLKRLMGKPLITDFRDPWLTNPFRGETSFFRDRIEAYLERTVVENSDLVISNTSLLNEEFKERFSEQPTDKFIVLLNGFDPEDYCAVKTSTLRRAEKLIITHTGFLYGPRDPRLFLEALGLLLETERIDRKKIQVFFVGSVELTYDLGGYLKSRNLNDVVSVVSQVSYQRSLEYLRNSDALLLLQPGTMTQIPSKLFEYVGMGKPILAISPRGASTHELVTNESIGLTAEATDVQDIASAILKLYLQLNQDPGTYEVTSSARKRFNVKNVTKILSQKFDSLLLPTEG